jgi:O-methyltransferase
MSTTAFDTAVQLHKSGGLDGAAALYRKLLADDPGNVVVMNNLSLIVGGAEAETLLRRCLALAPHYAAAHVNLGQILQNRGDDYGAIQAFEAALRADPSDASALAGLSRLLARRPPNSGYGETFAKRVAEHNYFFPSLSLGAHQNAAVAHLMRLAACLPERGRFIADDLMVWGRNLGFLDDQRFMASVQRHFDKPNALWRVAVVTWAARQGLRLAGDFVECGTYKGGTANVLCDTLDLRESGKRFWLYDVFDWSPQDTHVHFEGLEAGLVDTVRQRFADMPYVNVVQGYVPGSFAKGAPEAIAFLHVDLNNAEAEIGALEVLWDRVVPGALVILDDYGWANCLAQKQAEDSFFAARGYTVLELPTGQGLLIK